MTDIHILLLKLGIPIHYLGFWQTAYAVALASEDMTKLQYITKFLYPEVAKYFKTSCACVERNIRTAKNAAWENNAKLLIQMSQGLCWARPTTAEFLSLLTLNLYIK